MNASESIDEQAAAWVVHLEGTAGTEADRQALAAWTRRSPAHAASLARARASWTDLAHLHGDAHHPTVPARRRHLVKAAAALLLAAGTAGWVMRGSDREDHRTARGEVRPILLPDGSRVILAPDSALGLRYDAERRRVDLLAGEALFAPAPVDAGERRPFTVHAGAGRVRAVGTRFTVCSRTQGFDVAALEHGIEVSLDRPGTARVVVGQAEGLHYDGAGIGQPYRVDPVRQAAWTEGRLVFDRMALAEVVGVLNRYRPGRVVLASATLASRRVSGVFRAALPEDALRTIVAEVGARSVSLPLGTTLLF